MIATTESYARWANGLAPWAAALGLVLVAALPAAAQVPIPSGAQFEVNSYTTNFQHRPAVATTPVGDFVVVWDSGGSFGSDTSAESVQGQRHASDGSALGAEFQVNSYTTSVQVSPSVAVGPGGQFVVVWESDGSSGTDTSFPSIQGQRYSTGGTALGAQFQVNTYTPITQTDPSVAVGGDGDFVVVWAHYGPSGDGSHYSIQGQRYASDGSTQGGQFQVNSYTTNSQRRHSVSVASGGDFVVVWDSLGSFGTDSSDWSIQGQRYLSDGSPQGAQFQINTYTSRAQERPRVATQPDGDFVVVWHSFGDPGYASIQAQRYASDGSPQGAQFQINTYTSSFSVTPSLATEPDGDFVVVWNSYGSPGTDTDHGSIQGRKFASDGSAQGAQFQVNTYTTSVQRNPAVAARDGGFVVVWASGLSDEFDDVYSIQGQRYVVPASPAPVPALAPVATLALCAALLLGAAYATRRRV